MRHLDLKYRPENESSPSQDYGFNLNLFAKIPELFAITSNSQRGYRVTRKRPNGREPVFVAGMSFQLARYFQETAVRLFPDPMVRFILAHHAKETCLLPATLME